MSVDVILSPSQMPEEATWGMIHSSGLSDTPRVFLVIANSILAFQKGISKARINRNFLQFFFEVTVLYWVLRQERGASSENWSNSRSGAGRDLVQDGRRQRSIGR